MTSQSLHLAKRLFNGSACRKEALCNAAIIISWITFTWEANRTAIFCVLNVFHILDLLRHLSPEYLTVLCHRLLFQYFPITVTLITWCLERRSYVIVRLARQIRQNSETDLKWSTIYSYNTVNSNKSKDNEDSFCISSFLDHKVRCYTVE